jgi:hypothetical protein
MLGYFPVPYPDELLYSVIARYSVHTGLSDNHKAVSRDIFSDGSAVAVPDLPSHLDVFADNVTVVWHVSANEIISTLTVAPFYLPFLEAEKAELVIKSMKSICGDDIHTRCGIAASSIRQSKYFRYCPQCIEQQQSVYGEHYWRRTHQLPGIEICSEHQCRLIDSTYYLHPKNKHDYVPAISIVYPLKAEPLECKKVELRVYGLIKELMVFDNCRAFSFSQWTQFYQALASELGFKTGERVDHSEIYNLLKVAYSGTPFYRFIDLNGHHDWLTCLFRKHRKSFHPIRHLMVVAALLPRSRMKDVFEAIGEYSPNPIKQIKPLPVDTKSLLDIRTKRLKWLLLNRKHHYPGVKAIRSLPLGGALYAWLYRHDRNWLMTSLPRKKSKTVSHHTVDYEKWDLAVVIELKCYLQKTIKCPERKRLSQNHLLRQVTRSNSVIKHLKDLPKTKVWLMQHEESVEDFQIHRLSLVKKKLTLKGIPIKRWRLLREGCIRKELITPKLEHYILMAEREGVVR